MEVDWGTLQAPRDITPEAASPLNETPRELRRSSYRLWSAPLWALSFACWTVIAILDVGGSKAYAFAAGYRPPAFLLLFTWALTYAYGMAVLTPATCFLSERNPFTQQRWGRAILVQLPASISAATVAAVLSASLNFLLPWSRPFLDGGFRANTMGLLLGNLPRYFLIVASSQAFFYYERFRERELQGMQLEGQLAHARLSALKMQLQPHFIFNVLNAIATLTQRDPAASERMTLQLAELLRMSLQTGEVHQVPFRQELRFLECYLRIQQTRFVDRLSVELKIDASAMDGAVPPLLLQPLVENAIRHGISPRMASGKVAVCAERQQDRLRIEIRDDGVGLGTGMRLREGVGLRNTRARLQQLHGNNFEFICANAAGGGCQVTISIPYVAIRAGKEAVHADALAYR